MHKKKYKRRIVPTMVNKFRIIKKLPDIFQIFFRFLLLIEIILSFKGKKYSLIKI